MTSAVDERAGLRMAALGLGQLGVVVAFQAVAIVLPAVGSDLGVAPGVLQWLVAVTSLTYAGVLLAAGRLADRFGAPRLLMTGSLVMAAGGALAAVAPDFPTLLIARGAQGAGMALYTPAMIALLTAGFRAEGNQHRALVWWNVAGGLGGVVGVVGGGVLAQHDWRSAFWLLVLPPLITVVLTGVGFAGLSRDRVTTRHRVDLGNATLLPAAATLLVLGLTALQQGSPVGAVPIALSIALGGAWLVRERRAAHPLVTADLRSWPALRPVAVATLHGAAINTPIFFYGLFLQEFRGATPLQVGLGFLPANAGLVAGSVVGGMIARRRGHRATAALGMVVVAVGTGLLVTVTADSTVWHPFLTGWLVFGLGAAVAQVGFVGSAGRQQADAGGTLAGLLTAGGQIGTAIGLAVFVGIAALAADPVTGYRLGFGGAMVAAVIGAITAAARRRRRRPRPRTEAGVSRAVTSAAR